MSYRDESNGHRKFALPGASLHYGPTKRSSSSTSTCISSPISSAETLDGVCTTTVRALDEPVARLELNCRRPCRSRASNAKKAATFRDARREARDSSLRSTDRRRRTRHVLRNLSCRQTASRIVLHRADARVSGQGAARVDAEPGRERSFLVSVSRLSARESRRRRRRFACRKGTFALGNGALVERVDEGDTHDVSSTGRTFRTDLSDDARRGPFCEIEQRRAGAGTTPVSYYVLPGREADGERAFGNTPRMIEAFEERIRAAYPYARYSQIAVTDFIFGGMENTSATTQTDRTLHDERAHLDFSSDPLVSHELAHQWFGDLLTCRDWSHAWLNEGFATYFEACGAKPISDTTNISTTSSVASRATATRTAIAIAVRSSATRYRDPIELFDRHLYEKGGAVLHMLRGELGDGRFWRSIAHYVAQQRRTQRRNDRSHSRDRRSDRPQHARLLRSVGLSVADTRTSR